MTAKENAKDIKAKSDISKTNYGVNVEDTKVDAKSKHDHVPYDAKGDTKNRQNTVENR